MEINESIIEKFKAGFYRLDASRFATPVEAMHDLADYSDEEIIYAMVLNGKEIYSYMTEEEMCQKAYNCSISELLAKEEERKKQIEEEKLQMKTKCKEILKTKFPKYKKIYEECYPKSEEREEYIRSIEQYLKMGASMGFSSSLSAFEWFEKKVKFLEAARTLPAREVEKLYYQETDLSNPYFHYDDLLDSYYADVFLNMVVDDYIKYKKNRDGKLTEEEIDKVVLMFAKRARAAKALAAEAFKKQDAMAALKSRMRKPINEAKAQKTSNDLDAVLGEDSQKGKTTGSKQKD